MKREKIEESEMREVNVKRLKVKVGQNRKEGVGFCGELAVFVTPIHFTLNTYS